MPTNIYKPEFIREVSYSSDDGLKRRREFFKHEVNRIDIYTKIIDALTTLPSSSILDVGCGFGDVLLRLKREKEYQGRLVGIDVAPAMIDSAQKVNAQENSGIQFKVADAHQLPFKDEEFDVISCNFSLYSFENIEQVIRQIYRCLKTGGYFVGGLHQAGNRPRWTEFFNQAHKQLHRVPQEFTTARINLDTIEHFLHDFDLKETLRFESPIRISNPDLFLDYFDTSRTVHFFPIPSNEEWNGVIGNIRKQVQQEIAAQNYFEEFTKVGIFIAQK